MRAFVCFALGGMLMACSGTRGPMLDPNTAIRPPAVAGQFYPGDSPELRAALDSFFRTGSAQQADDAVAIVVPHAGYLYSGQIAADAYRQMAGRRVDTVVILGANHTGRGRPAMSVYSGAGFRTPLGIAAVDRDLAASIVRAGAGAVFDDDAHAAEHSIEVQVPFVQRLWPSAAIVPVVIGDLDPDACARFGRSLASLVAGRRVLIVASSDLSHYPAARDASAIDVRTLDAIASLDVGRLDAAIALTKAEAPRNVVTSACGEGAIRVAMAAASALGARTGRTVAYANSGDTIVGDAERAVGYGAVVFSRGERPPAAWPVGRPPADPGGPLDAADRRVLLQLARDTITRYLESGIVPLPRGGSGRLQRESGVFVTLRKRGVLRGCIGRLNGQGPLVRLASMMAFSAAFKDTRFEPVRADELAEIDIEVSVLTPMRGVASAAEIVVGRDGVVLVVGDRSAVFLPSVATEQGWDREELLSNLAVKAGLPPAAWREKNARFQVFQAVAFSERDER